MCGCVTEVSDEYNNIYQIQIRIQIQISSFSNICISIVTCYPS